MNADVTMVGEVSPELAAQVICEMEVAQEVDLGNSLALRGAHPRLGPVLVITSSSGKAAMFRC